jgi:hypothetical protein
MDFEAPQFLLRSPITFPALLRGTESTTKTVGRTLAAFFFFFLCWATDTVSLTEERSGSHAQAVIFSVNDVLSSLEGTEKNINAKCADVGFKNTQFQRGTGGVARQAFNSEMAGTIPASSFQCSSHWGV